MHDFSRNITDPAFDLTAASLVEASAGTGKTYNIQNAYLRLVLEQELTVDKILVVTFTEAATYELRDRLRKILALTRDVLEGVTTDETDRIQALLHASRMDASDELQRNIAIERIKLALMDFDNAAIFTIHGFCNRVLERYAFECGHDPQAELVADESEIIARICRNWWRQHTYNNELFAETVPFKDLEALIALLAAYLNQPDALLLPDPPPDASDSPSDSRIANLASQAQILRELAEIVRSDIQTRSVFTYNDMLRNVMLALADPHRGDTLRNTLRDDFLAAMIDEFQDTDPVQYRIFDLLFMQAGIPLVFVGDPKQAIYGFRGGDVFTYYKARSQMPPDRLFSLGTNYRSEVRLVDACNALFADRTDKTFLHESIPYAGDLQAKGTHAGKTLTLPEGNDAPMQIWEYPAPGRRKPGQTTPIVMAMQHDVANEIVRLLQDPGCRIGERPIAASDIVILVHTHAEANAFCQILQAHGVHAVRQNSGNVFDSQEARDVALILRAMLTPSDPFAVRGALAGNLLPCSIDQLIAFCHEDLPNAPPLVPSDDEPEAAPQSLDDWMALFREISERWRSRSFIVAWNALMRKTGMRAHIVQQPDGERKLTNTLHLAELMHQTAGAARNRPAGLVQWYERQLTASNREENEQHLMRLASDEDAVKIMTVFKSKGLQFPIVFVPTLWRKKAEAKRATSKVLTYHDESFRLVMTLDTEDAFAKQLAIEEHLQEDIRLVYVALTRAINRVYLIQFAGGSPDTYAVDHLLERLPAPPPPTLARQDRCEAHSTDAYLPGHRTIDPDSLATAGTPNLDHTRGHTSFSALEPSTQERITTDPRDLDQQTDTTNAVAPNDLNADDDLFSIPGGKQTGNCWHEIFEQIDFQSDPETLAALVDAKLDRYNICRGPTETITQARRRAVHDMVRLTLSTPLVMPGLNHPFHLRQIPLAARRSELEFQFALRQQGVAGSTTAIRSLLQKHWQDDPARQAFLNTLETGWDKPLPLGYLTGFIDLVCCHENRFYILDWKSNRRSGVIGDFGHDGIRNEMARNTYFLQYLLYTVALHGYLSQHLQDYAYETHIGGALYVFLRGIGHHESHGIFADRPSEALILDLAALLTGGPR